MLFSDFINIYLTKKICYCLHAQFAVCVNVDKLPAMQPTVKSVTWPGQTIFPIRLACVTINFKLLIEVKASKKEYQNDDYL